MQSDLLTAVRGLVTERLVRALEEHTAPFTQLGAPMADLLRPAQDLLAGGKRLRALLCAAGWSAAHGDLEHVRDDAVVRAGAALELFQAAALVHDDVMDGSLLRRGMPAAHRRFAADHDRQGWLGDPSAYGEAGAILLGDLLLTVSSMEMDLARALAPDGPRVRAVYDLMVSEVAVGQYLDIRAQARPWDDDPRAAVERALQVVRHKSARYSVEHPLVLGAALAGAEEHLLARLAEVGLPLGEAFQLRDDDLGVFGDPEVTGKPAGEDLREGKRTVLVALAMERLGEQDRRYLESMLGRPDLGPDQVAGLQGLLQGCGAVAAHEELIEERATAGLRAVAAAGLARDVEEAFVELAHALTRRSA
ncbi:polyprenyl synthetase family protein [Georgenia sp. 10Sc9-8]|uniref:Polyprenyl synthetase family protein n=1 Tax=Georgenia halotolerans TaxID=3028317 RepID=A0ABT5TXR4_9MICO|nr:polyprenyl synthetase family protein [Georgenia halotolerans]